MIPLRHEYPVIRGAEGRLALFSPAWLHAILRDAASSADCKGCSVVDDVAVAVSAYLRRHHLHPVIRLEDFERMMRHTLHCIGYPELAGAIRVSHPIKQVSLLHCMEDPPVQNEADFYARLQTLVRHCHQQRIQCLELLDLSACEARLQPTSEAFPWHQPSGGREKIVVFVRRQIARLPWPQQFHCSIR